MDCRGRKDPSSHLEKPHVEEVEEGNLSPMSLSPKNERLWEYPVTEE